LGGGLTENNPLLISVLNDELAKLVRLRENRELRVMASELGYYGGVLGAAALAFERAFDPTTAGKTTPKPPCVSANIFLRFRATIICFQGAKIGGLVSTGTLEVGRVEIQSPGVH
jgi:hypothetical protein